ncbi:hypothetical protein KTR66_03205 [Roseococcus sp. SDR]|uniref:hypothetical protein n=1 Tax=Roseococcus sp. SDR TaxID=2835532 RepID=UPI001BD12893|nr:hypothetical protein [Roseococcus sp. SDR]MBS7788985.1 hypothetical protein [Roseococcus sp. SDR]MBV1844299.1 hypothetical protein [Roseococcus sp. SDR]
MRGAGWMGVAALLLGTLPAAAQDCAGQVIVLGAGSQAEGAGFAYWATLSNPGMRGVQVEPRWAEATLPALRIEAGRMQRVRLGLGATRLTAEEIEAATRLRCQPIPRQP